jgi:predicted  nucleic acid-binding Zn-ribbon protein
MLQNLLELQALDVRLSEVRAHLASYPKKLAEADARVAAAKAKLDQSKAAQLAVIKDRKRYELDVEQWKERVRKYKDQTS